MSSRSKGSRSLPPPTAHSWPRSTPRSASWYEPAALAPALPYSLDLHRDGGRHPVRLAESREGGAVEAALQRLPPDDQVGGGADHLRDAGNRDCRAWRRSQADRETGRQVDAVFLGD